MKQRTKKLLVVGGVLAVFGVLFLFGYSRLLPMREISSLPGSENLPRYTATMLAKYDGTDSKLPIYLGLDGYVYDVTAGRSFYGLEGEYHALAGRDSSKDLRVFGGNIIKNKYPIIGALAPKM